MRKGFRFGLTVNVILAVVAMVSQGAAESSTEIRARLVAQANRAANDGHLAESRDLWRVLWELERSPVAACNIGALAHRIGDAPGAVKWLTLCLQILREPVTDEEREIHASRVVDLARSKQAVGMLRILAPAGATIYLDGKEVDALGEVPVEPGAHVIRAELHGEQGKADVNIGRAERKLVRVEIERGSAGPRPLVLMTGAVGAGALLAVGTGLLIGAGAAEADGDDRIAQAGDNGCLRVNAAACNDAQASYDAMVMARGWARGSLIAGGLLAVGTLTYAVYPHRAEVVVTGTGLAVRGTW